MAEWEVPIFWFLGGGAWRVRVPIDRLFLLEGVRGKITCTLPLLCTPLLQPW